MEASVNVTDEVTVGSLAARIDIDLMGDPDSLRVTLGGRDVTEEIRRDEVTHTSSLISTLPAVRRAMVARQREMGRRGAVLNGRDIGTVVFPDADVKFFLTAEPRERAQRRFAEECEVAPRGGFAETLADMIERDQRDTTREDSPLKTADDAVVIDSTRLSIEEVFEQMMAVVRESSREQ
jgi:cytidylate kinase